MNDTIRWVTLLLFIYNTIIGYILVNNTAAAYKLIVVLLVCLDYILLFYFVSNMYRAGAMRIMLRKVATKVDKGPEEPGLLKGRTKVVLVALVLYNIAMGMVLTFFTKPIALTFIAVDFFFIFYYVWILAKERLKERKFVVEHQEIIKQAMLELHGK